jgi:hypothetical protein
VKSQEWALEIKRRPARSFGEVETHSFAKSANEWGTPTLSRPPATLPKRNQRHSLTMVPLRDSLGRRGITRVREAGYKSTGHSPFTSRSTLAYMQTAKPSMQVASTLADLKNLPVREQGIFLLKRLAVSFPRPERFHKKNFGLTYPQPDIYGLAVGFPSAEVPPVIQVFV